LDVGCWMYDFLPSQNSLEKERLLYSDVAVPDEWTSLTS